MNFRCVWEIIEVGGYILGRENIEVVEVVEVVENSELVEAVVDVVSVQCDSVR